MVGSTYADAITLDIYAIKGDDLNGLARIRTRSRSPTSEKDELASGRSAAPASIRRTRLFVTTKGREQLGIMRNDPAGVRAGAGGPVPRS